MKKFIIIHFTNFSMEELERQHYISYKTNIELNKSNYFNNNIKSTYLQTHYYIDSENNVFNTVFDDIDVFHPFSNNAIHITIFNKYNFMVLTNDAETTLLNKIYEIASQYDIPFCNVITDFQSKILLGMKYKEFIEGYTYHTNDIVKLHDSNYYQILNDISFTHANNILTYNMSNISSLDNTGGKLWLELDNTNNIIQIGYKIYLYGDDVLYSDIIDNKICEVKTVNGDRFSTDLSLLSNNLPSEYKCYINIKPVSDYNIRNLFSIRG